MRQKQYWLAIGSITFLGLLLRLWQLGGVSYWIDESYSIALAKAITQHGWPITESGLFLTRSMLYHYLLAGTLWFTGEGSAGWLRLPSVMFSIGAVIAVAAVARQLFSQRIAVVTAALMALSVWEIAWSRQVRMYSALQCVTWFTVYCYLRWRQQPTRIRFGFMSLGVIATVATHELGVLVIAVLVLHRIIEVVLKRKPSWLGILSYSVGFIAVLIGAAALMHFGFGFALVNYWPHYWYYLLTTLPITFGLALLALYTNRTQPPLSILWLFSCVVFTIGFFSFAIELLQYRYIFFIVPAFFILSSAALVTIWSDTYWKLWRRGFVICASIIAIGLGEYTLWPKTEYLLESDNAQAPFVYKSITPQPNFKAAYQYLNTISSPTDSVITPYPTIQALYAPQRTHDCLYIDLTGTASQTATPTERYTGCPYLTLQTLCAKLKSGQGYILLDQFARQRIQPSLRDLITEQTKVVYTNTAGSWSTLNVYQPKSSARTLDCHTFD